MTIPDSTYLQIVNEAKRLVPNFRYTSNLKKKARTDYFVVDGLYLVDDNLICLHKPAKYKSKLHLAQVLYHELAHWCMQYKNTKFTFKKKYSNILARNTLEEIIAEIVARKVCYKLGYLKSNKKFDLKHIREHRSDLKELEKELNSKYPETYSEYYKEGLRYAEDYSNKIINYIFKDYL